MNKLRPIGLIEEAHGHKGTVLVKPLNGSSEEIMKLKSTILVDKQNNRILRKIYEIRKYRKGRFLIKFCGLKWRTEIEGYKDFVLAV
jgi:ribosomal 30S subunit maturation factor RimM